MRRSKRMVSRRHLVAGSIGTFVAGAAVALPAISSGQVSPGTRVNGLDISGFSMAAAEALLRETFAPLEERAVTYTFGDLSWDASLADLGMAVDYDAMLKRAMANGRDGSVWARYAALVADASERNIPLVLKRDEGTLRGLLQGIAEDIAIPARDARLELQDGMITVLDHEIGRSLDVQQAITDTNREIAAGEPVTIELVAQPANPQVLAADLEAAREDALTLVSGPVSFTHAGNIYPVDAETLAAALSIGEDNRARLDTAAMATRLDAIAAAVYLPPRNVKLGWDGGLYVVEADVDGIDVDREALDAAMQNVARSPERTAELPVTPVKAPARADNFDTLGIEGQVSVGSSSFVGSSEARAENVRVSANNISYKLVAPGETFSFNDLLGPITEENGFVQGTIIQGDFAATDIGGGVCQVSTTVFRAASNAGFQFTEWNPHTWRLAFYEADGSPPGYDGAIYQAEDYELDLTFTNPLDSWLLLMMVIDHETVSAHFYGRSNGWTVELGEPRLSEPKPIPEPIERENPNLAPGERLLVQQASAGVTVALHRTVTAADGSVISDGDFVSDYQSVPEVWEVAHS